MKKSIFHIGISGHQDLGGEDAARFIKDQIRQILTEYRQKAAEQNFDLIVYSALALGTDQLFVRTALELKIPVEIIIPCTQYEKIFSEDHIEEYHHLLNLAQKVHSLPREECTDDAYLAAGHWIVDHSDLMLLAWNGYPAAGRGGTGDIAGYARLKRKPFIHLHTKLLIAKHYGALPENLSSANISVKQEFATEKQTVYQGSVLTVNRYKYTLPNGDQAERDIVERPESVLILPVGQKQTILLIEEYDLGAGAWQLTLPGGKVTDPTPEGILKQAEQELREETGFRPGRLEKLLDFYSHPGYIAHKVHLLIARDLEWCPLDMEDQEEISIHTYTLEDALAETRKDFRCDPEAALALWLYVAQKKL